MSRPLPATIAGRLPSVSESGAASGSGLTNSHGPQVSTDAGRSEKLSGSKSSSRSERGTFLSEPSSSYVQAWYGHWSVSRQPWPRAIMYARWRQTLTKARSAPSRLRVTTIGMWPTCVAA